MAYIKKCFIFETRETLTFSKDIKFRSLNRVKNSFEVKLHHTLIRLFLILKLLFEMKTFSTLVKEILPFPVLFTHYLGCSASLINSGLNVHYYKIIFIFLFQLITPKFPAVVKIGHAHSGVGKVSWVPNHFANYWLIYDTMYRKKPMSCRLPIILQIKVNFHFIFLGVFGSLISGLRSFKSLWYSPGRDYFPPPMYMTKIFQLIWRQHFQEHLLLKLFTMRTVYTCILH